LVNYLLKIASDVYIMTKAVVWVFWVVFDSHAFYWMPLYKCHILYFRYAYSGKYQYFKL